ncbi:hypothetical protein GF352_01080 [archaeon]|nr:hypothetical protein [archaeon]
MRSSVKKDIINILEGVNKAFTSYDPDEIMELSNHIIHSASIYQEEHTTKTAIVVYSIGKIMARGKIKRYPQEAWNEFETTVRDELVKAVKSLKKDGVKDFTNSLLRLQQAVMKLDKSFMSYADYVVDKAKIKKGAKVHEHGISIKRIADLFGVSEWELRSYAGATRMLEREKEKSNVKKRLERVRRFFK